MLRIQEKEERAAASQNAGEMVGAPVVKAGGSGVEVIAGEKMTLPQQIVSNAVLLHQPLVYADAHPATVRAVKSMADATQEKYKQEHQRIGDLSTLVAAHKTYQEIAADQGAHEVPDEAYRAATFAGIHDAAAQKCGGVPVGCYKCEESRPRYVVGGIWIRHDGDKHYLVVMDASGHCTEYRIWFCPFCGKKF